MNALARPARRKGTAARAFALGLLLPLGAYGAVRVRPVDPREYEAIRRADVLNGSSLSAATRESLRILGMREEGCRSAPLPCLERLGPGADAGLDDERRLSAAAELWLAVALGHDRTGTDESAQALDAYLEAARASYAYLFYTDRTPGERALEDRQRQVRDFFNDATERVATLFAAKRFDEARRGLPPTPTLATATWRVHLGFVDVRLPEGRPLAELVPASRLSFAGLRNAYRRDGFGAELVAVAAEAPNTEGEKAGREAGYVAISAVLRFPGDTLEEVSAAHEATLEAYDSTRHESLRLRGLDVRLAANFTAPYALWLERSKFAQKAKRVLLRRTEELVEPRVFLMQPYDPERRTVILIHGLASSPEAWVDLANELMGDEEIRRSFQVWQVFYRTSAPIGYNRYAIRQALEATIDRFDPDRSNPASRNLALVGHSMGGVLARLLVADTGDRLWTALLKHPPQEVDRQRLAALAPYLDLAPMPEVSRAVFLASPHRGAPLASRWLGRLGAKLIRLPASLMSRVGQIVEALMTDQPDAAAQLRRAPDGVDSLSDRFPFRKVVSELHIAPWVTYHSIVGCVKPAPSPTDCSDGFVPYSSAHLEGAASELIVPSGHSVQKTPEAILELRRILHRHLAEARK